VITAPDELEVGDARTGARCPRERMGNKQMSYRESVKTAFVAGALLACAVVACSSRDDKVDAQAATELQAPASSPTAFVSGTSAAADDGAVGQDKVEHDLAQQFDLSIEMTSSEFSEIKRIPKKYGCEQTDVSPPIAWTDVPEGTVSLALLVDSDQLPGPRLVHWLLWGISPNATELPEAVPNGPEAPTIGPTARQGTNSDEKVGWSGPCPEPVIFRTTSAPHPKGETLVKRYSFSLFALDTNIDLGPEATKEVLLRAIDGHILAGGQLTGEQVGKVVRQR
jgi:Raf kinase inhibitor-like YbhB/YbcL family protein